ncbi:MAG: sugar transferase, partial [Acinetobacter junii]
NVLLKREGINAPGHVGPSLFQGNSSQNTADKVESS